MSVQIHINGENAAEAIKELAAIAAHFTAAPSASVEAALPKKNSRTKPDPVKEEAPAVKQEEESIVPDSSTEEEDDPETGDESIPTDVELRAAATAPGKDKAKIKVLLDKYEVKNLTSVPNTKRVAFMRELEAI